MVFMKADADITKTLADLMEVATAGFATGLHIQFTTPTFMFQTYPRGWAEEYSREGMVARDPTVAWAFGNTGRIAWRDLMPVDEGGVLRRAGEHGLTHGLAVSLFRGGTRSIGGFARSDRFFTPEEEELIEARMTTLHDATASVRSLPEEVRESLRRLSVAFTHP